MNRNITDINIAADAKTALRFWEEHPEIRLQETTCAQFKKTQAAFEVVAETVMQKEAELRLQLTERDRLAKELQHVITRLRSGVRGFFGPDSKEYDQVGGTRSSDRKRPVRRRPASLIDAGNRSGKSTVLGNGNGNGNADRNTLAVVQ